MLRICAIGSNPLSILYYNARSLLPKFDELAATVEDLEPTVICIVESWLSAELSDFEISLVVYALYRLHRNRPWWWGHNLCKVMCH